jgi:ATP-dependent Clp protease ATP-binding subunit ClpA
MFERFTEPSRRVVVLAQEEARMLDHNYIGTEHLLLGLIHEGEGVAARAIVSLGLTLEMAREQVRALVGVGKATPTGHIPFTPPAKKVLELSLREALALRKEYIGTEHLLLGLLHEAHAAGAQILATAAPLPAVRERVLTLSLAESTELGPDEKLAMEWLAGGPQAAAAGLRLPPRSVVRVSMVTEFRETLATIGETLAALEQRLTGIERQLGITPPTPEDADQPPDAAAGSAASAEGPDESTGAPEGDTPEESAE